MRRTAAGSSLAATAVMAASSSSSTMATTTKLSFRARNLDATKSMPVYIADELPDLAECAPINRAVTQMPTGMEKDEEMESHLQEAILAQQASTSGIAVENHVIPTPKVFLVTKNIYDSIYPIQPAPSANQLIKVQASLSLGNEQPEYDIDSEDEIWLAERGSHISHRDFEKAMELLESASSDLQICQPNEARILLGAFDDDLVDDVYDYWLQKRKDAAANRKIPSLIPRIKTDSRRDGGSVNPYIAFRRRAEKMQTRKNRKNDEDSYEKILKLSSDLGRAVLLFEIMKRREYSKLALIDLDISLFKSRWETGDFKSTMYNDVVATVNADLRFSASSLDESQDDISGSMSPPKMKKRKRHLRNISVCEADKNIINRSWLRRNAEAWNKPVTAANVLSIGCSPATISTDARKNADSAADGRYTFKRRRGCIYRASANPKVQPNGGPKDLHMHFYRTLMPSSSGGELRNIGYARRRVGRGGRIIFDRILLSPASTSENTTDPALSYVIDTTKTFMAKVDPKNKDYQSDAECSVNDDKEFEYLKREEHYARRIYDFSSQNLIRQRLTAGADAIDAVSLPTSDSKKVSGDTNRNANGVNSCSSTRESFDSDKKLKKISSDLVNLHGQRPSSQQKPGGNVNLSTAGSGSSLYQQKSGSLVRLASPVGMDGSSQVFIAHVPSSQNSTVHQSLPVVGTIAKQDNIIGMGSNAPIAIPIVYSDRRYADARAVEQQDHSITQRDPRASRNRNQRTRNGTRERNTCQIVPQLSSTLVTEANLQQTSMGNTMQLVDLVHPMAPCVDTKRLELAIAGSGARIKTSAGNSTSATHTLPDEPQTLKDLLRAPSNAKGLGTGLAATYGKRTYFVSTLSDIKKRNISNAVPAIPLNDTSFYVPISSVSNDMQRIRNSAIAHEMRREYSARDTHGAIQPSIAVTNARNCGIAGNITDVKATEAWNEDSKQGEGSTLIATSMHNASNSCSVVLQKSNENSPMRAVVITKLEEGKSNETDVAPKQSNKKSESVITLATKESTAYDVSCNNGMINYVTN